MRSSIAIRSLASATLVLLALAACTPAPDDAGDTPTVTETSTETGAPDAEATDPGADPSAAPDVEAEDPESPAAPPAASTPPPATAPPSAPPATPAVAVLSQQCTSGKLKVTLTASYDNSYRKGINSVEFERQNDENAWVDSDATWLGPETGQGNQWTGNPPGHKNQGYQDELRITVTASGGAETVLTVPITANC